MSLPIINENKQHTDVYAWQAIYDDGATLSECTIKDGKRIVAARYSDIDRQRLSFFALYPIKPALERSEGSPSKPVLSVEILPGYRLIFRKKRRFHQSGFQIPFLTIYMAGWQVTVPSSGGAGVGNKRNIQSIAYIYHNEKINFNLGSYLSGELKLEDVPDYKVYNALKRVQNLKNHEIAGLEITLLANFGEMVAEVSSFNSPFVKGVGGFYGDEEETMMKRARVFDEFASYILAHTEKNYEVDDDFIVMSGEKSDDDILGYQLYDFETEKG